MNPFIQTHPIIDRWAYYTPSVKDHPAVEKARQLFGLERVVPVGTRIPADLNDVPILYCVWDDLPDPDDWQRLLPNDVSIAIDYLDP